MNEPLLAAKRWPQPDHYGLGIDTCRGSLIHILSRAPAPNTKLTWFSQMVTYALTALIFGGLPIFGAGGNIFKLVGTFSIPNDLDSIWAGFFSVPLLLIFLRSERALIPQRILSIVESGVLRPKHDFDGVLWEIRFKCANIVAQLLGLCLGMWAACSLYHVCNVPNGPPGIWLVELNQKFWPAGWIYIFSRVTFFWFLCVLYVVRLAMTVWLLYSVVAISEVIPKPFHPDRAGGLSRIGKMALCNSWILAFVGIQVICAIFVARAWISAHHELQYILNGFSLLEILSVFVLGPIVFISPLLPFRKSMRDQKTKALLTLGSRLQNHVDKVVNQREDESSTAAEENELEEINNLVSLVEQEPVWPFDTITLKHFVLAYLAPVFAWLLSFQIVKDKLLEVSRATLLGK